MPARRSAALWTAAFGAALVFTLIVWGGIVHNTGSSLGCPDWPLCYGQVVVDTSKMTPDQARGVFWEHNHRYLGTVAGMMAIFLVGLLWRPMPGRPRLRGMALLLLGLVIVQGVLGGITVLLRLPTLVSTAHLAVSLVVFGIMIHLIHALVQSQWAQSEPIESNASLAAARYLIVVAIAAVFAQTILGGLVRHTASTTAAGAGWPAALIGIDPNTKQYSMWPSFPPALLNMLHRYAGLLVLLLVVVIFIRLGKYWAASPVPPRSWLIGIPVALIFLQVAIGIGMLAGWMVNYQTIDWRIVLQTLHLAVPTLLLANLYWLLLRTREPAEAIERT